MPTRTELPTISMTWTTMSSPTMTFSPGWRVMMSMFACSSLEAMPGRGTCRARPLRRLLRHGLCEQRGPHGSVRRLVDHLMATAVRDHNRRAEGRTEVRQLLARANGHPNGNLIGVGADPLGVLVGELDREVGEELPRAVTGSARSADEARGELDHVGGVDLD